MYEGRYHAVEDCFIDGNIAHMFPRTLRTYQCCCHGGCLEIITKHFNLQLLYRVLSVKATCLF
jgi:hypothetical protein